MCSIPRAPASPTAATPPVTRSGWRDSNPRPLAPKASALPSCATPRIWKQCRPPENSTSQVDRP
jgi:hypothetical protein